MEYRILEEKLRYPDLVSENTWTPNHRDEEFYVSDDYAEEPNFGFYENDIYYALNHAKQTIDRLTEQGDDRQKEDEACLVEDVKNYILCAGVDETVDGLIELRYLFGALAHFHLYDQLYDLVQEHYRQFEEEQKEGTVYSIALTFPDLYIELGDELLFLEGKPWLALKMYQLATLDWQSEKDSVFYETESEKKEDSWMQYYREYQYLLEGDPKRIRRSSVKPKPDSQCVRYYNRLISMVTPGADTTELLLVMNQFYEEFKKVMCECSERHYLRKVLMMAHRVREMGLLFALSELGKGEEIQKRYYWDLVLLHIRDCEAANLDIIQQYMNKMGGRMNRSRALYVKVLELAQVILDVERIKHCLLENDGRKDIAYYTSLKTFGYMLPKKDEDNPSLGKLSVMNVAYMNDPTEGKMLKRYMAPGIKDTDLTESGRKTAAYPYVFMKCFTTLIDDLPMWEMYGDHAKGCCIVLGKEYFSGKEESGARIPLYQVCYLRKDGNQITIREEDNPRIKNLEEVTECLEEIKAYIEASGRYAKWYLAALEDIAFLFKDADYNHEQELRIVYRFPKRDDRFQHTDEEYPKLFIRPDFYPNIKEFILGPKFEGRADKMPYLQEQIAKMCEFTGSVMPICSMSAIEYR